MDAFSSFCETMMAIRFRGDDEDDTGPFDAAADADVVLTYISEVVGLAPWRELEIDTPALKVIDGNFTGTVELNFAAPFNCECTPSDTSGLRIMRAGEKITWEWVDQDGKAATGEQPGKDATMLRVDLSIRKSDGSRCAFQVDCRR